MSVTHSVYCGEKINKYIKTELGTMAVTAVENHVQCEKHKTAAKSHNQK